LPPAATPPEQPLAAAVEALVGAWDAETRGWGERKFPMAPRLSALLAADALGVGAGEATRRVVRHTLDAMERGGLRDQLGGGFHRYTVDRRWQVPHFEQMLSDNAQLLALYATAAVALDEPRFAAVAVGVGDALRRDFLRDDGALH